ncbi:hypothetical protein RhiirA4_539414 [Rhizophagus irregularis]|uniref:Uncharacterized protein n=1 Tax=Rhizophagus irregularis TaxID=588596 RepID=A0A2I1G3P2_9GLOM|nr:hypothetical protein RhiirA4_539414 [Rhizophagus irregularis]
MVSISMYKGNKANVGSYFGTQLEIVGEENSRRVYYTIEALEELLCITEGKLYKCGHWLRPEPGAIRCRLVIRQIPLLGRISCTSKNLLNVDSALKEGSEDEKELHKNVKRVTEVIVVLLMDRVDVDKKPVMKKQLVQGYFEDRRNLYISMDVLYNELAFIFALLVHFPEEIFPGDMHANPSEIRF